MLKIDLKSLNKPKIIYIASVALLITSIAFYFIKEKEKKLRIYTQSQLTQTIEEKKQVENKLVDTIKAKEAVETELTSEKEKSTMLQEELEDKSQQIKLALDRVDQEISARRKVEAQLMITLKEKEDLAQKVSQSSETIELEKIVINPGSVITGKIIMVNKEYAFVVVNLGHQHNLNIGDILYVYRNDELIGKVQIERTEENMSAAAVLPDWQNAEFKENDVVKTM